MKREDVKIGMKVVPFQKTYGWCSLEISPQWIKAKANNQPYLYVICFKYENHLCKFSYVLGFNPDEIDGDYFYAEDFEPYVEEKEVLNSKKNEVFYCDFGSAIYGVKILNSKREIIDTYKNEISYGEYKVIINDKTTIVIAFDGTKGIAKCLAEDEYNMQKGIDIALYKCYIKLLQKQLRKLTK